MKLLNFLFYFPRLRNFLKLKYWYFISLAVKIKPEKELNGEKIILVRLLKGIVFHKEHKEKDLEARILELCKEWISEEELLNTLKEEGYTKEEILKIIESLIEKGKLLYLREKYKVR